MSSDDDLEQAISKLERDMERCSEGKLHISQDLETNGWSVVRELLTLEVEPVFEDVARIVSQEPENDAFFIARCRKHLPKILVPLKDANARIEYLERRLYEESSKRRALESNQGEG
ncbi:MAG: hypothetical protein P1V97_10450 [Planctomycetota bacterium]|nr:hypothetical protein [Planctomycetota bacterium]